MRRSFKTTTPNHCCAKKEFVRRKNTNSQAICKLKAPNWWVFEISRHFWICTWIAEPRRGFCSNPSKNRNFSILRRLIQFIQLEFPNCTFTDASRKIRCLRQPKHPPTDIQQLPKSEKYEKSSEHFVRSPEYLPWAKMATVISIPWTDLWRRFGSENGNVSKKRKTPGTEQKDFMREPDDLPLRHTVTRKNSEKLIYEDALEEKISPLAKKASERRSHRNGLNLYPKAAGPLCDR